MTASGRNLTGIETWSGVPRAVTRAPRPIYALIRPHTVPRIVFVLFLLFVATLPFEAADVGFASGSLSVAKISGLIFLACYFFYYNPLSGKRGLPSIPAPMWWFLAYVAVYTVNGFFLSAELLRPFLNLLGTLVQLLLIFWIASSLLQNELMTKATLFTFSLGSVVLATGILLGLPGFSTVIETQAGARITSLGFNANVLGTIMALAAIGVIGLILDFGVRRRASKIFLPALLAPLLAIIVRTGSRAAIGALVIGFAAFLLPGRRSSKMPALVIVLLGIGLVGTMVVRSPTSWTRLEEAYEGKLSDRQQITAAAVDMVAEKPIFGWKPVEFWQELGRRVGHFFGTRDAHNLFLHLLLEVGIVGAVPFLAGLWLCVQAAWKGRGGPLGIVPLALLAAVLTANLTHTYLTRKPFWLVMGLSVAAGSAAVGPRLRFGRAQTDPHWQACA